MSAARGRKANSPVASTTTPPNANLSFAAITHPELSPRACQVLWALTHWAWGNKPNCWPTNEQIAGLIHCSPRTVVFALKELVCHGFVIRRMVKTKTGHYRELIIAERCRPTLSIIEPTGGGVDGNCATPVDGSCATPLKEIARPVAQDPSPQMFEESEESKTELPPSSRADQRPTTSGGPDKPGRSAPEGEPGWLKVDQLTAQDVAHWRETVAKMGPKDPMGRIAAKILARWEKHHEEMTTAPGSPGRDPRGPSFEGLAPSKENPTKNSPSGQDKSLIFEHKVH